MSISLISSTEYRKRLEESEKKVAERISKHKEEVCRIINEAIEKAIGECSREFTVYSKINVGSDENKDFNKCLKAVLEDSEYNFRLEYLQEQNTRYIVYLPILKIRK